MDIARDKQVAKVITSSSNSRVVREKRLVRERRVVQCMHISNKEVQHFVSVCWCTTHNDINTNPIVCHNDNGSDQLTTPEVTEVQRVNPEVIAHADAMQSNNTHQF